MCFLSVRVKVNCGLNTSRETGLGQCPFHKCIWEEKSAHLCTDFWLVKKEIKKIAAYHFLVKELKRRRKFFLPLFPKIYPSLFPPYFTMTNTIFKTNNPTKNKIKKQNPREISMLK